MWTPHVLGGKTHVSESKIAVDLIPAHSSGHRNPQLNINLKSQILADFCLPDSTHPQ